MWSFLDFITVIGFIIDINWGTIAGLGFAFNKLSLDMVILILSIKGVGTKVFNISTLTLWSSLYITLINY